jgi:hypothetical protein
MLMTQPVHLHDRPTGQVSPKSHKTAMNGYVRGDPRMRCHRKRVAEATSASYRLHSGTVNGYL